MTEITTLGWTDMADFESDSVKEVVYNTLTNMLYISWETGVWYAYHNVPRARFDEFNGMRHGVGALATKIKQEFGPGDKYVTGHNARWLHNHNGPASREVEKDTVEHSLAPVAEKTPLAVDSDITFTVKFSLEGYDKTFKYEAIDAESAEDAIYALNSHLRQFGAKGRVKKVIIKFHE